METKEKLYVVRRYAKKSSISYTTLPWYDFCMYNGRWLYSIPTVVFGVGMVVYGGFDDSPGAQLLGLVVIILSIVGVINSRKKTSK